MRNTDMQTINEPIRLRPEDGGEQEEHRCEDILSAVTEAQVLEILGNLGEVKGLLLQVLSTNTSPTTGRRLRLAVAAAERGTNTARGVLGWGVR